MEKKARQVAREVKEMTRREIITKVIDGQISCKGDILNEGAR